MVNLIGLKHSVELKSCYFDNSKCATDSTLKSTKPLCGYYALQTSEQIQHYICMKDIMHFSKPALSSPCLPLLPLLSPFPFAAVTRYTGARNATLARRDDSSPF